MDLLPRVVAAEPGAAEECLDRYGGLVWSLAQRHTRTRQDAEDAVQEVFLAVWKNADRYDRRRASEAAFITMIARRRLIDLHRRRERRPDMAGDSAPLEALADLRSSSAETRAEAALAARALAGLEPEEQQAVLLSTCHGMSHREIAEHTGAPLGTVKSYIRRGLCRVRDALQSSGPGADAASGSGRPRLGETT